MIRKILIANRGEIALRIIRTCRDMDIGTVAVFSEADRESLHVSSADKAVCIGPAASSDSYLYIPHIISAALTTGCDAVHPGYGFLAENPRFAEICAGHDLVFIGPTPGQIEMMGNKSMARKKGVEAGVPVVPGTEGILSDIEHARRAAETIGYPVLLKASAGGGGRGMRVVMGPEDLENAFNTARQEASAAFGNNDMYMEKYILRSRHIEVQVLSDSHGNVATLGERDCTIQRRHQKLLEETPSPVVDSDLRVRIFGYAEDIVRAIGYLGAGTIELIMDLDNPGNIHFMEMNTRLQVEHPVTEMICGIDLVAEQIRVASGLPLSFASSGFELTGHAIECRINAEDPAHGFRPSCGRIEELRFPAGPWVRVDSHVYRGYEISPNYDSLIAKIVVWGHDRNEAVKRMARALGETVIDGIRTTIPFHRKVCDNPRFLSGVFATDFVERENI